MTNDLIVLVEDEAHLADAVLFNLRAEGYRTHHEADGEAALAYLRQPPEPPAAVLLDVMLPGMEGFEIARALRAAGNFVPILMLTARGRPEDVIEGFEAGADDYLPKPFDLSVLFARLHGLLRRMEWQRTQAGAAALPAVLDKPTASSFRFGNREICFEQLEIKAPDGPIRLTLMEADLLRYLIDRTGRVVSRREILEEVWRVREDTDTRAIDNFVVRLRRYLEPDPVHPTHLLTVRGIGYRFVAEGTWS